MTFNIGSQHAQTIHNAGRDQYIQYEAVNADPQLLLHRLREALADAELPPAVVAEAEAHLDGTEADLATPDPDKPNIADRLQRLTALLAAAGSVVTAATPLGGALAALAGWLGTFGQPIRERLG